MLRARGPDRIERNAHRRRWRRLDGERYGRRVCQAAADAGDRERVGTQRRASAGCHGERRRRRRRIGRESARSTRGQPGHAQVDRACETTRRGNRDVVARRRAGRGGLRRRRRAQREVWREQAERECCGVYQAAADAGDGERAAPIGELALVVIDSVDEVLVGFGANVPVTPVGSPLTLIVTAPPKPFFGVTTML